MSPKSTKTIATVAAVLSGAAAVLGQLSTVPQLAPYAVPLASLASLLVGWVHMRDPHSAAAIAAARDALHKVVAEEMK